MLENELLKLLVQLGDIKLQQQLSCLLKNSLGINKRSE